MRRATWADRRGRLSQALVLAVLLGPAILAVPAVAAPVQPAGCDNGLVLHADVGLQYIAGDEVTADVGALVLVACSLWHGSIAVTAYIDNYTSGSEISSVQFSVVSGAATITQNLGILPINTYGVKFVASGDGYGYTETGTFAVLHAPCNYQAYFVENAAAQANSFDFVPNDACTWQIQVTYPGGGFEQTIQYNGTGFLQSPPTDVVALPTSPYPSIVTIQVTDEWQWVDASNSCSQQAQLTDSCPAYVNDNEADYSFPFAANSPLQFTLILLGGLCALAVLAWIAKWKVSRTEAAIRQEQVFVP